MKAVVYNGNREVEVMEKKMPRLEHERDAIVKVSRAAICTSDLHILHGAVPNARKGITLGHELCGIVAEAGSAISHVKVGDRVAVNVETFCGECFYCRHGYVNNCEDALGGWSLGCRIDGGQAEYVRVPFADQGLYKIPEGVSDEEALFCGDLLSTGYWATELSEAEKGMEIAVIGAGPAGLCALMCLRLKQPKRCIVIDIDDQRLALAKKLNLADVVLNPLRCDVEKEVKTLTNGRGADRVVELAGGDGTFEMAWRIARPNAVVMLAAMYEQPQILPLPKMYGKNLIFKTGGVDGIYCEEILQLLQKKKIHVSPLITHRFSLSQAKEAYRLFEHHEDGVMKAIFVMEE